MKQKTSLPFFLLFGVQIQGHNTAFTAALAASSFIKQVPEQDTDLLLMFDVFFKEQQQKLITRLHPWKMLYIYKIVY